MSDRTEIWSDEKLMQLMRFGDRTAFEKIYNKYWMKLGLAAYNILRDKQASEDLVQEVFVNLWIRREQVKIESLNSYLYSAVRYKVFKVIRSNKVRESLFDEVESVIIDNSTENSLAEKELDRQIDDCIDTLPEKCKEIFILSRKEFLTAKEIAARLGISHKTVESQMTIALRRLRLMISNFLFWYSIMLFFF